jgi:hypothetical protein
VSHSASSDVSLVSIIEDVVVTQCMKVHMKQKFGVLFKQYFENGNLISPVLAYSAPSRIKPSNITHVQEVYEFLVELLF